MSIPRFLPAVMAFVVCSCFLRLWTLATSPRSPQDLAEVRQVVKSWLESGSFPPSDAILAESGVVKVDLQQFNPNALVIIQPGADGQPGVAGVDDNGDAIVDNRLELGATRSDDQCVVVAPGERSSDDQMILVMQKGAYVVGGQPIDSEHRPRAVVFGQSADSFWSFMVEM